MFTGGVLTHGQMTFWCVVGLNVESCCLGSVGQSVPPFELKIERNSEWVLASELVFLQALEEHGL